MNLTWIDLCSGLGGFSQPASDRGWRVITVDINPAFNPSIVADLEDLAQLVTLYRDLPPRPTMISASPVCTDFTKAGLPQSWAANRKYPPKPDTRLTAGCYLLIRTLNPDWWTIENVAASRRFLSPVLGCVYGRVDGHVFWGRLPCLLPETRAHKWRMPPSSDRAAIRAKIPYEIGEAICIAAENKLGRSAT